jgi:hypothetical protein
MTSYELWLFLHIAGAIVWIGGAVVAQVLLYLTRAMAVGAQMAQDGPSPALIARADRLVLIGRLLILVLLVIVFLMVVKPGT